MSFGSKLLASSMMYSSCGKKSAIIQAKDLGGVYEKGKGGAVCLKSGVKSKPDRNFCRSGFIPTL
jgi:hypothetical protein